MFPMTQRSASLQPTRDLFGLMDSLLGEWSVARPSTPQVARARLEVSERNGAYEVRAELPGVQKQDISVDIDGAWVSISAKAAAQHEQHVGERLLYSERGAESYARSFELPQAVDAAAAKAHFENGVLSLSLPKKDAPRATRLTVS
jgi:HSP20 family protein